MNVQGQQKISIILVNPKYSDDESVCPPLPVGLGYIAKSVRSIEKSYEFIDLNIDTIDDLYEKILLLKPDFLGISLLSYKCQQNYQLLADIKARFPDLIIIAGGPHVTTNMEEVLEECPAIDIGVAGEGEFTLQEILLQKPLDQIKGILYRKNSGIVFTGMRDYIPDLDLIPFPTYEGFRLDRYGKSMMLNSSRGCPYKCIFCAAPKILGNRWRKRSAKVMLEELDYWYQKGYRNFYYSDSNFGLDKGRIIDFCSTIVDKELNISITADGLRADHFNDLLLRKMWEAGFRSLVFGVESGSNKVLLNLRKGESVERIEDTIREAIKIGFGVTLFFIIGSPSENTDDIKKSFRLTKKYNIQNVYFFNLTPLPGTEYYEWALDNALIDNTFSKYPEEKFGFLNRALLPNDVMSEDQLTRWIKKSRHLESQIYIRHMLQVGLYRLSKGKIKPYQGQFTYISGLMTLPGIFKITSFCTNNTAGFFGRYFPYPDAYPHPDK